MFFSIRKSVKCMIVCKEGEERKTCRAGWQASIEGGLLRIIGEETD